MYEKITIDNGNASDEINTNNGDNCITNVNDKNYVLCYLKEEVT